MTRRIFENKENCVGCTACATVCPTHAIRMVADEEGFSYPQVQEKTCIHCGKCERVCPLKNTRSAKPPLHIFAAKHKDGAIRAESSSGGVFSLLAQFVEKKNGVIYGAAFDDDFTVKHMRAETEEQWTKFRTSKYVQSDLGDAFTQIRKDLETGKTVLFTGTPCQVDGLKHALKGHRNLENLITCDIVCHGVPSPKVWADWLENMKKQGKFEIGRINFRDKDPFGWHESAITVWDRNGTVRVRETFSDALFCKLFVNDLILRPSCHDCRYSNFDRPGDISLGDFWGIEKHAPAFDDNRGVSLVMCNTEKGYELFQAVSAYLEIMEVEQQQSAQPNLERPSEKPESRDYFWKWYRTTGLTCTAQVMGFAKSNVWNRMMAYAKRILNQKKT